MREVGEELEKLKEQADALELETLMRGDYDDSDAVLSLHAGAGGTEAQDWTQMLYRMYTRYCERMGFEVKLLDLLDGDEAGIKSVTFEVSGDHAYGYLRGEKGVHRLVRISPFDANARRHTSFSSLDVAPMLEDDGDEIKIDMKDVRVDTYHSSGAGGQNVMCVVLVLTILFGVIGFTGLAIPPRGLYKVLPWLPTADSDNWPESLSLGLDLRGGMYVEYSGQVPEGSDASFDDLIEGTMSIIRARLTDRGYTEANVQRIGNDGIRVEVPGVQDDSILDLIGAAAKMRFLDPEGNEFMTGDKVTYSVYILIDEKTCCNITSSVACFNSFNGTDEYRPPYCYRS